MKQYGKGLAIFFVLSVTLTAPVVPQEPKLLAAPDVVPPATEAMQHPEFWIKRIGPDAEKIVMTPSQIKALNAKNRTRPLQTTDINGKMHSVANELDGHEYNNTQFYPQDPLTLKPFPGDSLRIGLKIIRDQVMNDPYWDRRHLPYTDVMKREVVDLMGESAVPATVQPRRGILVAHTMNRRVPTDKPAWWSQFAWQDLFNTGALETGMPVAVLHTSTDGAWLYVRSEFTYGWISAANVAFGTPEQIRKIADPANFIVTLPHKITVYTDRNFTTFLTEIYQGTKLGLVAKTAEGYQITVPCRKADGSLEAGVGWLKPDADVSVGYQPFTQANVIRTMFRTLNRPYGWADSEHERDCCGVIRTVFKTFGIFVPRWTTDQLYCSDHIRCFPHDTPKDVKYKQLDACEPGITMCGFDGHIVMYLGKVDGSYFVIHSNGYSYHDKDKNEILIGRVGICDTEIEGGSYIGEWTELTTFKP